MQNKIKVRIQQSTDSVEKTAIVFREVRHDNRATAFLVLADNGKWREKTENEVLYEDEKFKIEEV